LEIRRRVLSAYEAAERQPDPARVRELLTFVVVGAGPTGVELAGALIEIGRQTVAKDFRTFDPRSLRGVLLEVSDHMLPSYPRELAHETQRSLECVGDEVRLDARVSAIDAGGVQIGQERLAARTVLWAAGVAASPLGRTLGVAVDRAGRVPVAPDLSVPGHPE